MNAMEKACWWEFLVSLLTIALVIGCIPVLGHRALGMFGCLGLLGFGAWFIRKRRDETVTDERDHEIQRLATTAGINVAWIGLFMAIIVMVVTNPDSDVVSKAPLQWVLWIHFAICYLVKGFVGVAQYRKGQRAS